MVGRSLLRRRVGFLVGISAASMGMVTPVLTAQAGSLVEPIWFAQYDGPINRWDYPDSLVVSPDGSTIYVAGTSEDGSSINDYTTIAYDAATGAELWVSRYNGPANGSEYAYALGVSPDGSRVYVTGASWGGFSALDDYATVAYDAATGAELWVARYNAGRSYDGATALGVSSDSTRLYVTGTTGNPTDYGTIAYDAATGAELWISLSNGPGYEYPNALGVSPDGSRVYVSGIGREDYSTFAYEAASGAQLWASRYNGPVNSSDYAYSLGVSPDGTQVYVTGSSYSSRGNDFATVSYDAATGAQLRVSRFDSSSGNDAAYALAVSMDGAHLYVTGTSYSSLTLDDYATVAYDAATGTQLWASRKNGRASDYAGAVAVNPDDTRVYVTGSLSINADGRSRFGTIAYDAATGAELWMALAGSLRANYANSLAVSPDGTSVYVTGTVEASLDGRTDFGTVAYVG